MVIKVKERSEKDIMIRCNTVQEKQFVLGIFLEIQSQPRMEDKILVKDFKGNTLRLPKRQIEMLKADEKIMETLGASSKEVESDGTA